MRKKHEKTSVMQENQHFRQTASCEQLTFSCWS